MFLSLQDPRAKVQGSVDPLGYQPIWVATGRQLVTNLTTVTNSVRSFTILLLGRYLTERLVEEGRSTDADAVATFLRFEQIGAYARHLGHNVGGDIRGIERVRKFVAEDRRKLPIQADSSGLILSDQKMYGLWGLYRMAAQASGLITDEPVGVTPVAREFIENMYLPKLRRVEAPLLRLVERGGTLDPQSPLFQAVVDCLPESFTPEEAKFYAQALRDAEHFPTPRVAERQANLATLLSQHTDLGESITRAELEQLVPKADRVDEAIGVVLRKILRLEASYTAAEEIFAHLQARAEARPGVVAKHLREHLGRRVPNLPRAEFEELLPEVTKVIGRERGGCMDRCDAAMGEGDYESAITAVLDLNRAVMAERGAAPWVRIRDGKLDVRYRERERPLPDASELPHLWRNTYFLDALKDVTLQLQSVN